MKLESAIERRVSRWADSRGLLHLKLNVSNRRGFPDHVFFLRGGKPLLIEFKRPGELQDALQKNIAERLRFLGYEVMVMDDAKEAIFLLEARS